MYENFIALWHVTAEKTSTVAKMLAAVVCTYIISYYLVKLSCLVKFFPQSSHLRLFSKL